MSEVETHSLHAYGFDPDRRVFAIKGLRGAFIALGVDSSFNTITNVLNEIEDQGYACVGWGDLEPITRAATVLEVSSAKALTAACDADEATMRRLARTDEPTAKLHTLLSEAGLTKQAVPDEDSTPQDYPVQATQTALLLVAQHDGNAVKAAAIAIALRRTTGQHDLYRDVVQFIAEVFPWVEEVLAANDIEMPQ